MHILRVGGGYKRPKLMSNGRLFEVPVFLHTPYYRFVDKVLSISQLSTEVLSYKELFYTRIFLPLRENKLKSLLSLKVMNETINMHHFPGMPSKFIFFSTFKYTGQK